MCYIDRLYILILLVLLMGCGSDPAPAQVEETPAAPVANEDDLLLRLSAYLSTDTSRAAREQNAIVDYAIEELLDVKATNSGLFYQVLQPGTGDTIAWGDFLVAHYKGYLLDGSVFADSRQRDRPLEFYVGNMIPGWNEGLQLLRVGGQLRLLVPSHLGYGAEGLISSRGKTLVTPHQILVFELEVVEKREIEK
ncbi:MAG: FKBP-type peptidyl-prolyl cis-trans isomerase [Bacteroidota bacterium]